MQVNIFNNEIVSRVEPTFNISFDDIEKGFTKIFEQSDIEDVSIIFTDIEYIQELNSRYRGIEAPSDVLSFNLSQKGCGGEIYICPRYIYTFFKGDAFEEEILRLIIHGTLHILGYDHSQSLDEDPNEEMFKLQEELLLKYIKICF